jgi:hypothetical protein
MRKWLGLLLLLMFVALIHVLSPSRAHAGPGPGQPSWVLQKA